jgi:hypothetical protein
VHTDRSEYAIEAWRKTVFQEPSLGKANLEYLLQMGVFDDVLMPHDADAVWDAELNFQHVQANVKARESVSSFCHHTGLWSVA